MQFLKKIPIKHLDIKSGLEAYSRLSNYEKTKFIPLLEEVSKGEAFDESDFSLALKELNNLLSVLKAFFSNELLINTRNPSNPGKIFKVQILPDDAIEIRNSLLEHESNKSNKEKENAIKTIKFYYQFPETGRGEKILKKICINGFDFKVDTNSVFTTLFTIYDTGPNKNKNDKNKIITAFCNNKELQKRFKREEIKEIYTYDNTKQKLLINKNIKVEGIAI
jgi:hypothetical protein